MLTSIPAVAFAQPPASAENQIQDTLPLADHVSSSEPLVGSADNAAQAPTGQVGASALIESAQEGVVDEITPLQQGESRASESTEDSDGSSEDDPSPTIPILDSWDISVNGDGSVVAIFYENNWLVIVGSGATKDLAFSESEGYWSSYRDRIASVYIEETVRPTSMAKWFSDCPNLTSLPDGFVIPQGVTDVSYLFWHCGLETLPEGFTLPSSVTNARGMFDRCPLTSLPDSFTLPEGLQNTTEMFFGCERLAYLPSSFTIPSTVTVTTLMFYECKSLKRLPESFALSLNLETCREMFSACDGLEALPVGFTIPPNVQSAQGMFQKCSKLTSIPKGFSIPAGANADGLFYLSDGFVPTTYLGVDLRLSNPETWKQWNRTLVRTAPQRVVTAEAGEGGRVDPAGTIEVSIYDDCMFTFYPDEDYRVAQVIVDGASVATENNTYTLAAGTEEAHLLVTFEKAVGGSEPPAHGSIGSSNLVDTSDTAAPAVVMAGVAVLVAGCLLALSSLRKRKN